jgi:hypothetical protein
MENYNRYRVKRHEFGHGQHAHMNPGGTEMYGPVAFRGFSRSPHTGRDYEENAGYRDNYNRLISERPESGATTQSRNQEGQYKGKGPRSYRRADTRIMEDINDRMCDNPYLDASDIEVSVSNGEVVLTGTVEDRESKRLAAEIGEEIPGVENVENRIRVKLRGI